MVLLPVKYIGDFIGGGYLQLAAGSSDEILYKVQQFLRVFIVADKECIFFCTL